MSAHYFISDAHVGAGMPEAERRLVRFIDTIAGRADSLCILGDLFEFWFEYGRVIPKRGFAVLAALSNLARSGTRLVWLKGNHDFWFGDFIERELGGACAADRLDERIDGRRVFACHGDALDRGLVTWFFRSLMRSRFNAQLYSFLHPDLGVALAESVARRSRGHEAGPELRRRLRDDALARLDSGYDLVLMGHTHEPEMVERGERAYINTGDWLTHFSYCVVRDGRPSLERFEP
ncbi:MAG: UDP-2,3-diacylglucosamine diphosphatase [bacterium]